MKLTTNSRFEPERVVTAAEAVTYVAERAAGRRSHESSTYRIIERAEAIEGMLGRLIGCLIDNGALRANQVEAIFDYDIGAE